MELTDTAELQALLEGIDLPVEKPELIRYAAEHGATSTQLGFLGGLPDEEFQTIDEVAEELVPVQPAWEDEVPHEPREESGAPPGGDDYTTLNPASGAVRDSG